MPGQDDDEFLRVNNAAFDWHPEQGGWDRAQLRLREAEPWFDPAGFLLAVDGADRLLGFHWTKVHRPGPTGRSARSTCSASTRRRAACGWAPRSPSPACTICGSAGSRDVLLYVEADNAAAVRLYGSLGFTRWQADVSYRR